MECIREGDIVACKSYSQDIHFKVVNVKKRENENIMTIKGISYRIEVELPESELKLVCEKNIMDQLAKLERKIDRKSKEITIASRGKY